MNTDVSTHRIADASLRGAAATIGFIASAAIGTHVVQAFAGRAAQMDAIQAWCAVSKACVGVPSTFGPAVLTVQQAKLGEASELVATLASTSGTAFVEFPRIAVATAARTGPVPPHRQKNRPPVGGIAK